jgi:hypothetical protein
VSSPDGMQLSKALRTAKQAKRSPYDFQEPCKVPRLACTNACTKHARTDLLLACSSTFS